jgi:pimeloyl-[acyl-carrier protein] methyl ester esterase
MVKLVLLPGMHGTDNLFSDFVQSLGKEIDPVIVPYPEDKPLNYEELTQLAQTYLPVNERYVLLGESFSGPVAIALAAAKPPGLCGLVLCGTFASSPLPYLRPLKSLINFLPMKASIHMLAPTVLLGRFATDDMRKTLLQTLDRVSVPTMRTRAQAALVVDYTDKLNEVTVPVLYLHATEDRIVPSGALQSMTKVLPGIRVVNFTAPHMILQTSAKEAADVVRDFCRQSIADGNAQMKVEDDKK